MRGVRGGRFHFLYNFPMPYIEIRGAKYYYEEHGRGDETIVFSHGFLMDGDMFRYQVEKLKDRYRVITFDWRGQGRSEATPDGYDMDELYLDAVEFLKRMGCEEKPCHWVGLSMGGFIGMRIAARQPGLLKSLILAETSAEAETFLKKIKWGLMAILFKLIGPKAVEKGIVKVLFGKKILEDPSRRHIIDEYIEKWYKLDRDASYKMAWAIFNRKSVVDELKNIRIPVLIIVGDQDIARTVEEARRLKELIPHAKLVIIEGAGHSSALEEPEAFTHAILEFLREIEQNESKKGNS